MSRFRAKGAGLPVPRFEKGRACQFSPAQLGDYEARGMKA
jgi:hypothetical protein